MSDSNPTPLLERTSLIVYDPDIFNCSRQTFFGSIKLNKCPASIEHCESAELLKAILR